MCNLSLNISSKFFRITHVPLHVWREIFQMRGTRAETGFSSGYILYMYGIYRSRKYLIPWYVACSLPLTIPPSLHPPCLWNRSTSSNRILQRPGICRKGLVSLRRAVESLCIARIRNRQVDTRRPEEFRNFMIPRQLAYFIATATAQRIDKI